MTDKEWKEKISKIESPLVLLQEMVDSQHMFGDNYHRDLTKVLWNKADELIKKNEVVQL